MKAERGFLLADPRLGEVAKAGRVAVDPGMTSAEAFETIVSSCLLHFRVNEQFVVEQRMPAALHQLRVALRRLRAALSLFRSAIRDERYPEVRDELRWLTGELGEARDLDVFLQNPLDPDLRRSVAMRREAAYDGAIEALKMTRFVTLMPDIASWAAKGRWREREEAVKPIGPYAARRIDRLWRGLKAMRHLRRMSDEERHELRIHVKKLRYALEFLRALYGRSDRRKVFGKALEDLQESLGLLNDAAVARSMIAADAWAWDCHGPTESEQQLVRCAAQALDALQELRPYWR